MFPQKCNIHSYLKIKKTYKDTWYKQDKKGTADTSKYTLTVDKNVNVLPYKFIR
jgi:hypothetical protein